MLPKKSTTQTACGIKIPTAAADASRGLSNHIATTVSNKAVSQKYKKFVGP